MVKSRGAWALGVVLVFFSAILAGQAEDDLINLARSDVDEEVLLTYIDNVPTAYKLTADDIITLKDLGVSSRVIEAALHHMRTQDTLAAAPDTQAAPVSASASPAPETVVPPTSDENVAFFYQSLSPYGTWISVDGAWYWQPSAAAVNWDWAPYRSRGHWVYTDWGWAWVSDYSWGWAPFHYGRWFHHHDRGWLWAPDRVWGPAWVSWRTSDDYFGWAPLPPSARYLERRGFVVGGSVVAGDFEFGLAEEDYYFVPARHFCDPEPWEYALPRYRTREIYSRTAVVPNNYHSVDEKIIDGGPSIAVVSRATQTTISPVNIVRTHEHAQAAVISGGRLTMYGPPVPAGAPRIPASTSQQLKKVPAVSPQAISSGESGANSSFVKQSRAAAALAAQKQRAAARVAQQEQARLELAAQHEPDVKRQASLRAEAEVQRMRAQEASRHAASAESWKGPAYVSVQRPRSVSQRVNDSQGSASQRNRDLVARVHSEAQAEQNRKQTEESAVRNQVQEQILHERQPEKGIPPGR